MMGYDQESNPTTPVLMILTILTYYQASLALVSGGAVANDGDHSVFEGTCST